MEVLTKDKGMIGSPNRKPGSGGKGTQTRWYFQASASRKAVHRLEMIAKQRDLSRAALVREILEDYASKN